MGDAQPPNPAPKPNGKPAAAARPFDDDDFEFPRRRAPIIPVRRAQQPAWDQRLRSDRTMPIKPLNGLVPLIVVEGRGHVGKTTLARLIVNEVISRRVRLRLIAIDPAQRLLAEFVKKVRQPNSAIPADIVQFFREELGALMARPIPTIVDCGGGSTTMGTIIRSSPKIDQDLESAGIAIIPAYFLSTSPDDAFLLEDYAALGFTPQHTLLVLNAHLAKRPSGYDAVRAHPAYRAAIARGAIEIVLPDLDDDVAQRIEAARWHFGEALTPDIIPEGKAPLDISPFEAVAVRDFIENFRAEVHDLAAAGWMPWE